MVKIVNHPFRLVIISCTLFLLNACGGNTTTVAPYPKATVQTYPLNVQINGLSSAGLVLKNSSTGESLSVASGSTSTAFKTAVEHGGGYAVSVETQPTGASCTVTSATASNVTAAPAAVVVDCRATTIITQTYPLTVQISGLTSAGLVLKNSSTGESLSVASGATSASFKTAVEHGSGYAVSVQTQPTGASCALTSATASNVTATPAPVEVTCQATTFPLTVQLSGLTSAGLVLKNSGTGESLSVASGATSASFKTTVEHGGGYAVSVETQPTGASCTLTSATASNVTATPAAVVVDCRATTVITQTYPLNVQLNGLNSAGLVLKNSSTGESLSVASGSTSAAFKTAVEHGGGYAVSVQTQPTGASCTLTSATASNVTATPAPVEVTCQSTTYPLTVQISGLSSAGLVLKNSSTGESLSVASGATSAAFKTAVEHGSGYAVSVQTQPTGASCTVTSATASSVTAAPAAVVVDCRATTVITQTYPLTVQISGLTSAGLVLKNSGTGESLSVASGSTSASFKTAVEHGGSYTVSVQTQPTGASCTVTSATASNVTATPAAVVIACQTTTYPLTVRLSGLTSAGLVLKNSSTGESLSVASGATSASFKTAVEYGSGYAVSVQTQPTGASCTVTSATASNVTATPAAVVIACQVTTYPLTVQLSGLSSAGLVLKNSGTGESLSVASGATSASFKTAVEYGSGYAVSVQTQPTGASCALTSATASNVTATPAAVVIACQTTTYPLTVRLSGLTSAGLVLKNSSTGESLSVASGATSASFKTAVEYGKSYTVSVQTQPTGASCALTSATASNVTATPAAVVIACQLVPLPNFKLNASWVVTNPSVAMGASSPTSITLSVQANTAPTNVSAVSGLALAVKLPNGFSASSLSSTCGGSFIAGTGTEASILNLSDGGFAVNQACKLNFILHVPMLALVSTYKPSFSIQTVGVSSKSTLNALALPQLSLAANITNANANAENRQNTGPVLTGWAGVPAPTGTWITEFDFYHTPLSDPGPFQNVYWGNQMIAFQGYTGLQSNIVAPYSGVSGSRAGRQFIFSAWGATNAKPGSAGARCTVSSLAADRYPGVACAILYPWQINHTYRINVKQDTALGDRWYTATVTDETPSLNGKGDKFVIASIYQVNDPKGGTVTKGLPAYGPGSTDVLMFTEYYDYWQQCSTASYTQMLRALSAKDIKGKVYAVPQAMDLGAANQPAPPATQCVNTGHASGTNISPVSPTHAYKAGIGQTVRGLVKAGAGLCLSTSLSETNGTPLGSNYAKLAPCATQATVNANGGASFGNSLWVYGRDQTIAVAYNYCLSAVDGRGAIGSAVVVEQCIANAANQRWSVTTNAATGDSYLTSALSGACVTPSRLTSGTTLTLQTCTSSANSTTTSPKGNAIWTIPGSSFTW